MADMADKREVASGKVQTEHRTRDQSLISAMLMMTPAQRLTRLEEVRQLVYTTGALKPRRFISKENGMRWITVRNPLGDASAPILPAQDRLI